MAHGRSEVRCGVSALGGLVHMLYDKFLFVVTAEVDVVVGSLSMHTLHSFVWNGLVALTFSVITTGVFICTAVVLTAGWSTIASVLSVVLGWVSNLFYFTKHPFSYNYQFQMALVQDFV